MSDHVTPRGRRSREEAKREILDAAERLLAARGFSALTVRELMKTTQVGRSTFYLYFRDLDELMKHLLIDLEDKLVAASSLWLEREGDPLKATEEALRAVVQVWVEHGPVLRAIVEAAAQDTEVNQLYRWGLIQRFIEAIAERIDPMTVPDPEHTALALILMNERVLLDQIAKPDPDQPERVVRVLYEVWTRTLYPHQQQADSSA